MSPNRPYLIRAIYEWIIDNALTPYLLVQADASDVHVPAQSVQNGKIVLNLAPHAVRNLELGNDNITLNARFNGKAQDIFVPTHAVLAIYAKENGQGLVFNKEEQGSDPSPPPTTGAPGGKPNLRIVK